MHRQIRLGLGGVTQVEAGVGPLRVALPDVAQAVVEPVPLRLELVRGSRAEVAEIIAGGGAARLALCGHPVAVPGEHRGEEALHGSGVPLAHLAGNLSVVATGRVSTLLLTSSMLCRK